MAKIDLGSVYVGDAVAGTVECAVAGIRRGFAEDDDRTIGDIDDAVRLLRRRNAAHDCPTLHFRVADFPCLTVTWKQFGMTAAIAHVLRDGKAETVHFLWNGQDAPEETEAIESLRSLLRQSFPADFKDRPRHGADVIHHKFVIRSAEADEDFSDLLGMIALVPIFCEFCGIR